MASVGNQAQLGIAELMDVLLDEPRVTAIGLHLEGLKNVPGSPVRPTRRCRKACR